MEGVLGGGCGINRFCSHTKTLGQYVREMSVSVYMCVWLRFHNRLNRVNYDWRRAASRIRNAHAQIREWS